MFARSRAVRCWIIVSAAAVALAGVPTPLAAADGSIVAWGSNTEGQTNVPAPNSGFVAVAGGQGHTLGVKANGSIVAWGWNPFGQTNVPAPNSGFVAVAGGSMTDHSLGLKAGLRGDLNCDGQINALDIEPFLLALFDPDEYPIRYPDCDINLADINGDGSIDALDIEPFLDLLFS